MATLRLLLISLAVLTCAGTDAKADPLEKKRATVRSKAATEHAKLAAWCARQKLHGAAKRHYLAAKDLDPGNAKATGALAGAFPADAPGDPKRAATALQKREAKLNKKLAKLWGSFATWATKKKHADAALEAWRRLLQADPTHPQALRAVAAAAVRAIPFDQSALTAQQKAHPQTQRALRIFRKSLPGGLATLQRKLGITIKPGEVKVQFLWGGGKMAAVTRTGTPPARVRVYCDRWTARKAESDLVTLVCHEMVHAAQAARMGHEAYGRIPKWFREGIALHVADQGPSRLRWALDNADQKVDAFLNGLEAGKQKNPEDYAEGYLAVRYLLSALGPKGFDDLHRALIARTPFDQAIERATGKAPRAFEAAVHAFARKQHEAIAAEK